MKKFIALLSVILVANIILFIPPTCQADDFGTSLKAAMASFPPYPDIAGIGGAWVAVARLSSDNPASLSIFSEFQLNAILYTNPNYIHFNRGRGAYAVNSGILVPLVDGCLKISYTSINADRFCNKKLSGSNYALDSKDVKIYYGKAINDKISLGISFKPWINSKLKLQYSQVTLGKSRGKARFNIRPGILYQPVKGWYLGLTYEYTNERIKMITIDPLTLTNSNTANNSYAKIWRVGTSWQAKKGTLLSLDWQGGEIDDPLDRNYQINKFFFGIEQYCCQNLAFRIGSLDGSPTFGLSLSIKKLFFDYTYIKESLSDLNPYCGSSKTHAIAMSLTF